MILLFIAPALGILPVTHLPYYIFPITIILFPYITQIYHAGCDEPEVDICSEASAFLWVSGDLLHYANQAKTKSAKLRNGNIT